MTVTLEDLSSPQFRQVKFKEGYVKGDVDDFVEETLNHLSVLSKGNEPDFDAPPVNAQDVLSRVEAFPAVTASIMFADAYDMSEVEEWLNRVGVYVRQLLGQEPASDTGVAATEDQSQVLADDRLKNALKATKRGSLPTLPVTASQPTPDPVTPPETPEADGVGQEHEVDGERYSETEPVTYTNPTPPLTQPRETITGMTVEDAFDLLSTVHDTLPPLTPTAHLNGTVDVLPLSTVTPQPRKGRVVVKTGHPGQPSLALAELYARLKYVATTIDPALTVMVELSDGTVAPTETICLHDNTVTLRT